MVNDMQTLLNLTENLSVIPELKAVLNALPFYVLLVDEDHKILFANNAVTSRFGLDTDKILGGFCPKVIHGRDGKIPECPLEESVLSGHAVEREVYDNLHHLWLASAIYPANLVSDEGKRVFFHMVHDITTRKNAELELKQSLQKLQNITESSIRAITLIVEQRDPFTAGHQTEVGKIAYAIAKEMGYDEKYSHGIEVAGLLHDIGKIAIPIEILSKPGKLNANEYAIIKSHPAAGYNILKGIDFDWPIAKIVLQHHERMNGGGYPNRLTAEKIIKETRIISVADVYEAMTAHRPYRPALSVKTALDELEKNKDTLFDKDVVDACVKLVREKRI
jgi:putative nucleotidyltransferase with HDIG domain/PAS domain S-box-containing protein